jgi:hypothetical protein
MMLAGDTFLAQLSTTRHFITNTLYNIMVGLRFIPSSYPLHITAIVWLNRILQVFSSVVSADVNLSIIAISGVAGLSLIAKEEMLRKECAQNALKPRD